MSWSKPASTPAGSTRPLLQIAAAIAGSRSSIRSP